MDDEELREMLLDALINTMSPVVVPAYAINAKTMRDILRERGYSFAHERFLDALNKLIEDGVIKKGKKGRYTLYWFAEEPTQ